MDEPESVGALHLAAHEGLDNSRSSSTATCSASTAGPCNGKIIQELEALFRGAGGRSSR